MTDNTDSIGNRVDHISIPSTYVSLASQWYSGQGDLLYAVSSTGGLTLGNRRPKSSWTDQQWYLYLWRCLSSDVYRALMCAAKERHPDTALLVSFEEFVDSVVAELELEYELEDWE